MKMRKLMSLGLVLLLVAVFAAPGLYAKDCDQGKKKGYGCDFEKKVLGKMHLVMENQGELALSEDQVKKIKTLKIATKKDLVRNKADIDVLAIDMKVKLSEATIDIAGVNKIIDQKYELKKAREKSLVAACAEFKGILTDEQKQKLKKICSERKKGCSEGKKRCPNSPKK